jgi:hypothetical protein
LVKLRPIAAALLAALAGCKPPTVPEHAPAPHVALAGHDAFFLWPGVHPPPEVAQAKTLYLLDGEVRRSSNARLTVLRPAAPHITRAQVWLVIRLERLDWQPDLTRTVLAELERWQGAGTQVVGLQLDFDSGTRGLDRYTAFLRDIRQQLSRRYRLSVTGLLDWSAHGDPAALAKLGGTVDEVVIQTYQGRRTIPGYEGYLAGLGVVPFPYCIGVVEGGEWREPAGLARDPHYRGTVVFLLPR